MLFPIGKTTQTRSKKIRKTAPSNIGLITALDPDSLHSPRKTSQPRIWKHHEFEKHITAFRKNSSPGKHPLIGPVMESNSWPLSSPLKYSAAETLMATCFVSAMAAVRCWIIQSGWSSDVGRAVYRNSNCRVTFSILFRSGKLERKSGKIAASCGFSAGRDVLLCDSMSTVL